MHREQEHMLDACLFSRLQKALATTFRRPEQSKCIGDLARAIFGYRRGIVCWLELEPGFFQPAKVRRARIGKKGLTRREEGSHPARTNVGGSETEGDHKHHREVL